MDTKTQKRQAADDWPKLSTAGFIGGLVILVLGLLAGYGVLAGIGFVEMAVSFIFLNSAITKKYGGCRKLIQSARRYASSRGH